ncbi:MAG: hypothetical protein WA985_09580 [Erythrobacter sp.]
MARTTPFRPIRLGAVTCTIAAFGMAFAPAQAAAIQTNSGGSAFQADFSTAAPLSASSYDAEADKAEWRGRRGWRHRGWRHRRGPSAGDVIAGVAILGGIAAIASAANNNRRHERDVVVVERNRYERDREWQQDREIENLRRENEQQERELEYLRSRGVSADRIPQSAEPSYSSESERYGAPIDLDAAIDRGVEVIEIDATVAAVDGVDRTASGWNIVGQIEDGETFTCRIGRDGQIEALENGRGYRGYSSRQDATPAPGQWSGSDYADARAALDGARAPLRSERMPAYPGGPLPGEEDFGG